MRTQMCVYCVYLFVVYWVMINQLYGYWICTFMIFYVIFEEEVGYSCMVMLT